MLRMYEGGGVENPAEVVKRLEQVDDIEMFDDKEECEERGEVDGKEEVEEGVALEEGVTIGLDCMTSRMEEQDASVSRELESDLTRWWLSSLTPNLT